MNSVTLHGKVGWVGEERQVGDTRVINFNVADTRKVKDEFETTWWSCAGWGYAADKVKALSKGQDVTIFGKCEGIRQYKANGEDRVDLQLRADAIYPGKKSEKKADKEIPF